MGCFFFFKQKTAYEMRISDWSSDVCSSDLNASNASGSRNHERSALTPKINRKKAAAKARIVRRGKSPRRASPICSSVPGAHGIFIITQRLWHAYGKVGCGTPPRRKALAVLTVIRRTHLMERTVAIPAAKLPG